MLRLFWQRDKLIYKYIVWNIFNVTISPLQAEQQREMEGLLDSVRQLTRELRREMLLVDSFIPVEYQVIIVIIIIVIITIIDILRRLWSSTFSGMRR